MLSTATLQWTLDKLAYCHWQYLAVMDTTTSGTSIWNKYKDAGADVVPDFVDEVIATDSYISGTDRIEKYVFGKTIAALETHARTNGYASLDEWTSGLVNAGSLEIDEGFAKVYKACRTGRTPSQITPSTVLTSGTRTLVVT